MKNSSTDNKNITRDHLTRAEIKRFIDDSMPREEGRAVENHLIDCVLCRNTVEYVQENGMESLEEIGRGVQEKVRKKLAEQEKTRQDDAPAPPIHPHAQRSPARPERPPSKTTARASSYRFFATAATIVVLAVVGYFAWSNQGYDLQKFQQTYAQASLLELDKKTAGDPPPKFSQALEAYQANNLDQARQLFTTIPPSDTHHIAHARAYLADIDRLQGDYTQAIAGFEAFRRDYPGTDLERMVRWQLIAAYTARADIQNGDLDRIESLLTTMQGDPNESQQNVKRAGKALEDLEKVRSNLKPE